MPAVLFGIPVAVALAWWLLKGGPFRMPQLGGGPAPGDHAGGLETSTRQLRPGEEDPFKREELPFERSGQPSFSGGEVGGPYGPETQEQAPSAPADGYSATPEPTQTYVMEAGQPKNVPSPYREPPAPTPVSPQILAIFSPRAAPPPAPAPTPSGGSGGTTYKAM